MKKLITIIMLVLLGALLTVMVGSETYGGYRNVVNNGRNYCPVHNKIYDPRNEVHKNCQPVVRHVAVAQEQYCEKCNTKYSAGLRHVCLPAVRIVKKHGTDYYKGGGTEYRYSSHRHYNLPVIKIDIYISNTGRRYGYYGGYYRPYRYNRIWFGGNQHKYRHHEYRQYRQRYGHHRHHH
jgi:hypothetical protein